MDVFDLVAKLTLDKSDYEKGLDKAKGLASKVGNGIKDGAVNLAKNTAKATMVAVGAGATAIGALGKQAIDAYADYEQLSGGVETLFSKANVTAEQFAKTNNMSLEQAEQELNHYGNQVDVVMENAKNAYLTAGMSTNEYMETVTGFSASLISSLGEYSYQAGSYADVAITDMADNANKMGSSMESIQNAYQGFSKQNYTMLDNLKLGYGGTKEEMERLLRDAEKMEGLKVGSLDVSNFADIVSAIHTVQEEMGITGTTAQEAGTTISGSIGMMKSAWANLVAEMAKPDADIGTAIENLFTTIVGDGTDTNKGVIGNLVPAIKSALSGIGKAIEGIAPVVKELLPILFNDILPPLVNGAIELIKTLAKTITDNLDMIMDAGLELLMQFIDGAVNALPKIFDKVGQIVKKIRDFLIDGGNLEKIVEGATKIIVALAGGLIKAIPQLVKDLPKIIKAIFDGIVAGTAELRQAGKQLIDGLWNGIKEKWEQLKQNVKDLANGLVSSVKGVFGIHSPSRVFANIGEMMVAGLEQGSDGMFSTNGLHANVSAKVTGGLDTEDMNNNRLEIDYDRLGQSVASALAGFSINMDGRSVARLIAGDMNYQLGVLNARRV